MRTGEHGCYKGRKGETGIWKLSWGKRQTEGRRGVNNTKNVWKGYKYCFIVFEYPYYAQRKRASERGKERVRVRENEHYPYTEEECFSHEPQTNKKPSIRQESPFSICYRRERDPGNNMVAMATALRCLAYLRIRPYCCNILYFGHGTWRNQAGTSAEVLRELLGVERSSTVLPSCKSSGYNNNSPGKVFPAVQ